MKKALLKFASKTNPQTVESIKARFSERLNSEFEWKVVEDESLIGGFVAYIDGTVYDCTVATKLEAMKIKLAEAIGGISDDGV